MRKIIFPALAIAALLAALIFSGYYPAMSVNGKLFSRNSINSEIRAEETASEKLGEAYKKLYEGRDLLAEIVNAKVEDALILEELRAQLEPKILEELQNSRLDELSSYGNLDEASRELYGMSLEKMKEKFLLPLVRRNILENQMLLNNQDFNAWLSEAKQKADIKLFISSLRWNPETGRIERK
jgi:hypothetical protein